MTFEHMVKVHEADVSTMPPGWRALMVDYVLRAWSEAEDRRFSSTMWLHDFAPSTHSIEQVAA